MYSSKRVRRFAVLAVLAFSCAVAADELPAFKQGMWAYSSTKTLKNGSKPQERKVQLCTSPTEDIRKKWDSLAGRACQFTPLRHNGAKYVYSSSCERNGVKLQTISVITVESDSSYRVDTESRTNNAAQKEAIVAKRVGDCTK
jgi:hypothetical protein